MTEQETSGNLYISTEHASLISSFMGKEFPVNITWNELHEIVDKIETFRMTYPNEANVVCDCKVVIYKWSLYSEIIKFIKWYNTQIA